MKPIPSPLRPGAFGRSGPTAVSVVLACFRQARELELTLLSFLRQDFPRELYELIVVDDDSPDHDARGVVAGLRRSYPDASLHYVRQYRPGGGAYGASAVVKNLGTRLARGRYVWFNNAEIVQAGESLEYVFHQHESAPGPLCLRGRVIDLPFETLWGQSQEELDRLHDVTDRGRERVATADHAGLASMPRDLLVSLGGIDERFDHWGKEDLDLAARLKRVGVTYRYDERVKSFHVSHPANHVKGPDYDRMCRLLEENEARGVTRVNLGRPWGERLTCPVADLDGTVAVTAGPDPGEIERRLETLVYGPGAERCEVLVAALDSDRPAVEELLERRFPIVSSIALAGVDHPADARRLLARIRTSHAALWTAGAADPRPRWAPAAELLPATEAWLHQATAARNPPDPRTRPVWSPEKQPVLGHDA